MSYTAFAAVMLVCIYLSIIAQNMRNGATVWACSVSLFVVLMIRLTILLIKGVIS